MAIEQAPVEINLREPRRPSHDFYALLWLGGWGAAAAIALSALVLTSQTPTANERLRSIFAVNEPAAVAQMPPRVAQLESETRMLMEQVRTLSADRDRLNGRIALLESSIDDMTGTIKRQAAVTAAALAAKTAPPAPDSTATKPAAQASVPAANAPAPPPVVAAVTTEPKADSAPTSAVPLPPGCATQPAVEAEPPTSSEFGLDLGWASTLDGVRQRWATVKANFGPLLSGMHPLAAPDRRQGKSGYRLVVGPLPNGPAATGLCAHFNAAHTACPSVKFDGEQIAQR